MCETRLLKRIHEWLESRPTGSVSTIAILGGDGRLDREVVPGCELRVFKGPRAGGNGELRRFERALRAGSFDCVFVLARWNGHPGTRRARLLCRRLGVPFAVHP